MESRNVNDLNQLLVSRIGDALASCFSLDLSPAGRDATVFLEKARDPRFGDLACSAPLRLARSLRLPPLKIAQALAARLSADPALAGIFSRIESAPPGFVNFTYADAYVLEAASRCYADPRLGVPVAASPLTVVFDYSSPNVAKPMHVGHIRSTILGDALIRLYRFLGHRCIGDNHLGDWGTQFGMILLGIKRAGLAADLPTLTTEKVTDLYRAVNAEADASEPVAEAARQEVVRLHSGDPENRRIWQAVMTLSLRELDKVYRRLGVSFDQTLGESFYEPMLPAVVESLKARSIARLSEGALAVFFENDKYPPFLVQKRDGAFLYATTDLATVQYRVQTWHPDVIVYVTDSRQQLHFNQLFEAARMWGFTDVRFDHVWFGTILGPDGKPFKTRSGEVVRLEDLLDEAEERARAVVDEKSPDLPAGRRRQIASAVGIGALKYADLSQNRTSDYLFSWEKFLALSGNTAPYMQYAYARVRSIFRKGDVDPASLTAGNTCLASHPAELALARTLLEFNQTLLLAAREYRPNVLTSYLFDLAGKFTTFYDACPVLKADTPELRLARLALCDHVARVMHQGLELLGIQTIEQM